MKINEYLKAQHKESQDKYLTFAKRITCKDGFSISVQANELAYCRPRHNMAHQYSEVECGFPSSEPELIMQYAEEQEIPTETVYCYVPVELVDQLIESHGGIA